MCLKHLFEKVSKKPEDNYIQLEDIVCEPTSFDVKQVFFIKKDEKLVCNKNFNTITLSKDRIIFDDVEHIKYDYIMNFNSSRNNSVIINTCTNIHKIAKFLYVDDAMTSIAIQFNRPESVKFMKDLMFYLNNYKKYDSWDKRIKEFKVFKLCFGPRSRHQ